jgi:hypothetical protein
MLKLNKATYMDKLHACWLGKNIGGTLGAPYEGSRELRDVKGFVTKKGEPLPNDDLDLQLVWLVAMERMGPARVDANVLSNYWLECIPPYWNEYGTCKTNLRMGLLPPMSGELDNEKWKTSNGAWIRSELWAALAPGVSDVAIKYAVADATVDHGLSEGTHAEVFTATFRDYGLAPTVGVKTFGKGIMQTVFNLSAWGNYSGYIKLTTYAYVTKCGVSYHGLGIMPDHTKEQSAEALAYHYKDVPQALDDQLNAAFDLLAS